MAPRRALVLARPILDAVERAHGRGVVHRDLKPENAIVTAAGAASDPYELVKLLDFGLVKLLDDAQALIGGARLTGTGTTFGTPTLFEMLIGAPPFAGRDALTLLRAHGSSEPPRLGEAAGGARWCTPALEALVGGALVKAPRERFASAAVMRACLDEAFASLDAVQS